jgi:CheY-like chemotaxis protein
MTNQMTGLRTRILLIDDSFSDALFVQEALKESKLSNNIDVMRDGFEALAFLRQEGKYKNAVHPDLILLDLNLPRMSGLEILAEIKSDNALKLIPVIMLSSSQAEDDILQSYNLYANAYVTKPVNFEQFITVIKSIQGFWIEIVKLPPDQKE